MATHARLISLIASTMCMFAGLVFWTRPSQRSFQPHVGRHWPIYDVGVGFDLGLTHGAVALSYGNDKFRDVFRLEGDLEYKEAMKWFNGDEGRRLHPPYKATDEAIRDWPRQLVRQVRRTFGLPRSPQAGTLAKMVAALKVQAERVLKHPVTAATIATPHLRHLHGEDVLDIFEHLGIKERPYVDIDSDERVPHYVPALWAANGLGLCRQYTDQKACLEERRAMNEAFSFAIGVEPESLSIAFARMRTAHFSYELPIDIEYGDGFERALYHDPHYAMNLSGAIAARIRWNATPFPKKPIIILTHGAYGADKRFLDALDQALVWYERSDYRPNTTIIVSDPAMSVARGAAEMARIGPPFVPSVEETFAPFVSKILCNLQTPRHDRLVDDESEDDEYVSVEL